MKHITTLPQALERIDELETELDMLKRDLGHSADDVDIDRLNRRWKLTGLETRIVLILHRRKGAVVNKESLLSALYDNSPETPAIKIIDVFVCKIRAKVGADFIATAWGHGYRLTPSGMAQVSAVLGMEGALIERAEVQPRAPAQKSARQVALIAALARHGPMDIAALHTSLPEEARVSRHSIHNALAGARRSRRVRVVDWRAGADGLRRATYEATSQGVGYVRLHAPSLLDIPA